MYQILLVAAKIYFDYMQNLNLNSGQETNQKYVKELFTNNVSRSGYGGI